MHVQPHTTKTKVYAIVDDKFGGFQGNGIWFSTNWGKGKAKFLPKFGTKVNTNNMILIRCIYSSSLCLSFIFYY